MKDLESILITPQYTLKEALRLLDKSKTLVLLMINEEGSLQRTITDGDIRRLLLSDCGIDDTLAQLPDKKPVTVNAEISDADALTIMNVHQVSQLPVIDSEGKPIALHLRNKIQPRILLSIPHMGELEKKYVEDAFQSNWIAPLGPNVDGFEKEVAEYVKTGHAAAVNSGTAAIHLALRLLNVSVGDTVFCSSFTFVASANPILYQGAQPVFIDSEPETWNMSPQALERAFLASIAAGRKPKAVIVVHLYGQSAKMSEIMAICNRYDVPVIEDAAESLGGLYQGQHTGTFGKFGIFSFNGNKIITTSGGGMLISDDKAMIEKARCLSTQAKISAPHYEHTEVGYNYRMSNVLAGIGRGQLSVLNERIVARRQVFEWYKEGLSDLECLEWMPEPEGDFSNRWLTAVRLNPDKTCIKPSELIAKLSYFNIEARNLWKPMHLQPLFSNSKYFPHSNIDFCSFLFDSGLCLPSGSNMNKTQVNFVVSKIKYLIDLSECS